MIFESLTLDPFIYLTMSTDFHAYISNVLRELTSMSLSTALDINLLQSKTFVIGEGREDVEITFELQNEEGGDALCVYFTRIDDEGDYAVDGEFLIHLYQRDDEILPLSSRDIDIKVDEMTDLFNCCYTDEE